MIEVHTFGCKVNTYDSGLLQNRLAQVKSDRRIVVLNTCAVTQSATDEALRTARRLKRQDPQALLVLTGCSAQVDTERLLGGADLIVANSHKTEIGTIVQRFIDGRDLQNIYKSNIFKKEEFEPGGGLETHHTRAFLKIQDGCDSFCTFCVIPFARGKSRSLGVEELVRRVQEITAQGLREVVLTGVHIGDYHDEGAKLEDLIEAVLMKTSVPRLRLTSLEPIELSERLLDFYSDARMCRHFHMSIQSANSRVLEQMKRRYTAQDVARSLSWVDKVVPGAFVGMDVIAGFPGETKEEFLATKELLASHPWTRLHVFPYSARPGTYATRLPDSVSGGEISRRAGLLRELSHQRYISEAEKQIGTPKQVLVLKGGRTGLSRDYWTVELDDVTAPGLEIEKIVTGLSNPHPNEIHLVESRQPVAATGRFGRI